MFAHLSGIRLVPDTFSLCNLYVQVPMSKALKRFFAWCACCSCPKKLTVMKPKSPYHHGDYTLSPADFRFCKVTIITYPSNFPYAGVAISHAFSF